MLKSESYRSKKKVRVNIRLHDGTIMDGHVFCNNQERVSDLLNDERDFFPFESMNHDVVMLSKKVIAQLVTREEFSEKEITSNPYKLLGVSREAGKEAIREAYKDRVRAYHPDRIIALDLPEDMTNYANDMLSRINTAYETLMERIDQKSADKTS